MTHLNLDGGLWNTDALDIVWHVVDDGEAERQADPDRVEEEVEEDEHAALQSQWVMAVAVVGVADRDDARAHGEQEGFGQALPEALAARLVVTANHHQVLAEFLEYKSASDSECI